MTANDADVIMLTESWDIIMTDSWDDDWCDVDMDESPLSPVMHSSNQLIDATAPCTPPRTLPFLMTVPHAPRIARVGLSATLPTLSTRPSYESSHENDTRVSELRVSEEVTLVNEAAITSSLSSTAGLCSPKTEVENALEGDAAVKEEPISPTLDRAASYDQDPQHNDLEDHVDPVCDGKSEADEDDHEEVKDVLQLAEESLGPVISQPVAEAEVLDFLNSIVSNLISDDLAAAIGAFSL